MKINAFKGLLALSLTVLVWGCSGVEVNTMPIKPFAEADYATYSWRSAAIGDKADTEDLLAQLDPAIRSAVDAELTAKGYEQVASDGDFVIKYQFKSHLTEGV